MYQQCKAKTLGFTLTPIVGPPTAAQLAAMCAEPMCLLATTEIRKIETLGDCLIVNADTNAKLNVFRFARDYDTLCAPTKDLTTAPTSEPTVPVKPSC